MKAALQFAQGLAADGLLFQVRRIQINLYGSLGATGRGHGSDRAVLLGLEGESPDIVNTDLVEGHLQRVRNTGSVWLLRQWAIPFQEKTDLKFHWKPLPFHPNGMVFQGFDREGKLVRSRLYYSIGGGFVVDEEAAAEDHLELHRSPLPYPFKTALELLEYCKKGRYLH